MGLGSGIRKKPILDPGSKGEKGTARILDPQHCMTKTNILKGLSHEIDFKNFDQTLKT